MPLRRWALRGSFYLIGTWLLAAPFAASAQATVSVRAEENFRREPNGVVLARLNPAARLRVLSTQGNWTEVEVEATVWLRSLNVSDDPDLTLIVSAAGGENLRVGPAGEVLGRVEEGVLLEEVDRDPAWARVSRVGWIWSASLATAGADGAPAPAPAATRPPAAAPSRGQTPTQPASRAPGGFTSVGAFGGPILTAPDGDTLAVASPASDIEVVRREGNWARVRLEGWMWMPPSADAGAPSTAAPQAPAALEPDDLRTGEHTGRVVQWTVQFISLERAEAIRTDFFEGEPFLLSRFRGGDGPFVYVAVPPERLSEVEGLVPLERVSVTGRIRTGSSALTGAPIIDLISIERSREQE
jgi:hypothetical protein